MSVWRPIESAPRDRTILVWNGDVCVAAWCDCGKVWMATVEGLPAHGPVSYDDPIHLDGVTHWMPLPEPPEPNK